MAPHPTGVWIDDETGGIVFSPPHRGTQLVRKGSEVSSNVKGLLAARGIDPSALVQGDSGGDAAAEKPVETATEPADAVETAVSTDSTAAKATAAAKKK